jgi:4-amino-4-deoxy-L-arabinose transferase-like glycosyltransferase
MSPSEQRGLAPSGSSQVRSWFSPGVVLWLLAGYYALGLGLQLWVSDTAELDQAEQLVLTQQWRWGYGSQPPLYTWVQALLFSVFGVNLFALELLKGVLLFSTCLMTFLAGRELSGGDRVGLVAVFSLFFLPQFVWESQRDLTHSVMATTFTAATVWIAARLGWTRSAGGYAALGILAAGGLLSKYNYGIFLAALLVAMVSRAEWRPVLRDPRIGLSVAVCALCLAAPAFWVWQHPEEWLGDAAKLQAEAATDPFRAWLKGLGSLLQAGAGYALPLAAAHLVAFRWAGPAAVPQDDRPRMSARLLTRLLVVTGLVCVLAVCFRVRIKERWLLPLLYVLPLWVALRILPRLGEQRVRRLALLSAITAVVVLVAQPLRLVVAELTSPPQRLNRPDHELAEQLQSRGIRPAAILADNRLLAGNLRLSFPASVVSAPDGPSVEAARTGAVLIVWHAGKDPGPPAGLAEWVAKQGQATLPLDDAQFVEAPFKYFRRESMKLGYVYLPSGIQP